MKKRNERILEVLAAHDAGCTVGTIAVAVDPSEPAHRTSAEMTALKARGHVERRPGKLWVITRAGRAHLRANQDRDRDLSDTPVVVHTKAVDGQAPRDVPNSPFTLARGFRDMPPPPPHICARQRAFSQAAGAIAIGGRRG